MLPLYILEILVDSKYIVLVGNNIMSLNEALIDAAQEGDLHEVKRHISQGATSLNRAFILAAGNGHLEVAEYLVILGVDAREQGGHALISAVMRGCFNTMVWLMNKGANPNAQNGRALMLSTMYGHRNMLDYLIERGLDVKIGGGDALINAVNNSDYSSTAYLISKGVRDPELLNEALKYATFTCLSCCRILVLAGADANDEDHFPLLHAAKTGQLLSVIWLTYEQDATDYEDRALTAAIERGHNDIVAFLLDARDPNLPSVATMEVLVEYEAMNQSIALKLESYTSYKHLVSRDVFRLISLYL